MSETASEHRAALLRQRRFLILMSLAVIAFYALGIEPKDEANVSGLGLKITQPGRVVIALWIAWGWSLWRYAQRVYELLSVLWGELLDDVYAEDRRIALVRARRVANRLAAKGQIDEELPKSARVSGDVRVEPPTEEHMQAGSDGEPVSHFRDFFPTRSGGRKYPTLAATFDWVEGKKWGSVEETFKMELTRAEARWLRIRAWLHSVLRLPAFSEHIAPFVMAAAAVLTWLAHQSLTMWVIATFTTADGQTTEMAFIDPSVSVTTVAECAARLPQATPGIIAAARTTQPQRIGAAKLAGLRCVVSTRDPLASKTVQPSLTQRAWWKWIRENNAWLIGIGGIAATILGWRFGRSLLRAERGSTAIAGGVSESQVQSLSAGNGSTIQQAQQITTVHQGLSLREAELVAQKTFEANFIHLAGAAADIAHARATEFVRGALAALERTNPAHLNRVQDPAFMQSLYVAQHQYATSGQADLQSTLVALLIQLASATPRSLLDISLQEAIEKAHKITRKQMQILALVFVITRVRWAPFYRLGDLDRFAEELLAPLLDGGVSDHNHYSHLASLGCLQVGPARQEISVFFMSHWRSLLTKGIPPLRVEQLEQQYPGIRGVFVPIDKSDLLRLGAQTNEDIERLAASIGLPSDATRKIFQLDSEYLRKGAEQAEFLRAIHPAIARLWAAWTEPHAALPRTELTTLGVTLAHAYLSTLGKAPAPLAVWISPGASQ